MVVLALMRLNYVGRRTAVAMAVMAIVAVATHLAGARAQQEVEPEVSTGLKACFDQTEQSFFRTTFYPYSKKNVRPGVTFEQYQAAMVVAFTGGLEACAKRECKKDVRECKNVPYYESINARYRRNLAQFPTVKE